MKIEKTLHNENITDVRRNTKDLRTYGNGDLWQLLCKVSSESEGWMKSTKVMEILSDVGEYGTVRGCLVQVTTHQGGHVAEALTYIPNVQISSDGKRLISA